MNMQQNEKSPSLRLGDNETVKFTYNGDRYCVHIRQDDVAFNPRDDYNVTTMACFHSRYRLGDNVGTGAPERFWIDLVNKFVTQSEVFAALEVGDLHGIRIQANVADKNMYDVYERVMNGSEYIAYACLTADEVVEYIMDDLTIQSCQHLLEPYLEWMPLWLYDHSGISISCGSRTGQYADSWDSGCVGWIIMTKDTACGELGADDTNWREKAISAMELDVEIYDEYLTGDVYGFQLLKQVDGEWEETDDSCWGFYGSDIVENGIADDIPGLLEAIKSGDYEIGTAERHVSVSYTY